MNNLFCPKGKIDRCTFIINYLMLLAVYIILGIGLFLLCAKFHKMLTLTFIVLFFIKILITFNYKKRLMDIFENLPVSIILAIMFAFDTEIILPYVHKYGNSEYSSGIILLIFAALFFVPAIILALIPSKKHD